MNINSKKKSELSLEIHFQANHNGSTDCSANGCEDERIILCACDTNVVMMGVVDGCGGSGSERYPLAENWTGARIAAHEVGNALEKWFYAKGEAGFFSDSTEETAAHMQNVLSGHLASVYAELDAEPEESLLVSDLIAELPTTLAMMTAEPVENEAVRIRSYWAGNSRNYVLLPDGLRLLSRDNLVGAGESQEPMGNGILSNTVNASKPFKIFHLETEEHGIMMLLSATDGVFGYFDSPIRLEWILLDTLQKSKTPLDWEKSLKTEIDSWSSDDHTMELLVFNAGDFQELKKTFLKRWSDMKTRYIDLLERASARQDYAGRMELWKQYKTEYLEYLSS